MLALVGAQRAHGDGVFGQLVATDDDGERRAAAIGHLHLGLHAAVLVGPIGGETGGAQLGGEPQRLEPTGGVDDEHVDGERLDGEHALVVAGQQRAIEAEREADAVRRRPAERLDQAVVAPAAAERVLRRVERAALELERRVPVVVEAAHELGRRS